MSSKEGVFFNIFPIGIENIPTKGLERDSMRNRACFSMVDIRCFSLECGDILRGELVPLVILTRL